jgi:FkbM family methyltransferase
MSWKNHALLFSPAHRALCGMSPIGLIDCGARGTIPEPWASLETAFPNSLQVVGFEADAEEAARLTEVYGGRRRYVPAAAWNAVGTRPIYITERPQTSSLFPPNAEIQHYFRPKPGGFVNVQDGRAVARVVDIPTTTIDVAMADVSFDVDFLKIDTQGAEYEILEGAAAALDGPLFGVVAETWATQIYKGVKPMWEVMRLLASHGYQFMRYENAGSVRRSFPGTPTFEFTQIAQMSSFEVLFFREARPFVRAAKEPAKAYKAVGIADAFGHADYGVEILHEIVMRWPEELANVQACYKDIVARRSVKGAPLAEWYPKLH